MNHEALDAATFRKARGCADKNCVEVGGANGVVGVRDSTDDGRGLMLAFTADRWKSFLARAKSGYAC